MVSVVSILADFFKSENCQQTISPTLNQSCSVLDFLKSDSTYQNTDLRQVSSQRNYIKFLRMKLYNRKIEARNS